MTNYPPIVSSSLPAFAADTNLKFIFKFPPLVSSAKPESAYRIQYKVSFQKDNKNVLSGNNSIKVTDALIDSKGNYYILISNNEIINGWTPGEIYKIQIRLAGKSGVDAGQYSEWSTICYVKATAASNEISVSILNASAEGSVQFVESPVFMGQYTNKDEAETELRYKFTLLDYNNKEIIETTEWKLHEESEPYDSVVFSQGLNDFQRYILNYAVETKNGYNLEVDYTFLCSFSMLESPVLTISGECDQEEGLIKVLIESQELLTTNLVLRRTDSRSNYTIWEDYKIFNILDSKVNVSFTDYLIENGIEYIYGVQVISKNGYRSALTKTTPILAEYEYTFLVGNDKQLKIKYNPKVSSWKRQLQETKTETIGSKYPFILRSGAVNYFTFPISGLISYHLDEAENFCSRESLMPSSKIVSENIYDVNLTNNNIVLEREFRNQVEDFLTNGDYKYFKSSTEGVKLVAITGVSLTPNDTVGRMLYTFSATAYEVGEVSLSKTIDLGIVTKGEYLDPEDMGEKVIRDVLPSFRVSQINQDIFKMIADAVYDDSAETYTRELDYLTYLKIEITNLNLLSSSGYRFTLTDESKNPISIVLSKELGIYELDNVIKIYGLNASSLNVQLNITYEAVCKYHEKSGTTPSTNNYQAVSKLTQLYSEFVDNTDIINAIKNSSSNVNRIINLTYLKIDAAPGAAFEIEGERFTIGDSGSIEFRNTAITKAMVITSTLASITAIYNGFEVI